jgi:hypothetical protein
MTRHREFLRPLEGGSGRGQHRLRDDDGQRGDQGHEADEGFAILRWSGAIDEKRPDGERKEEWPKRAITGIVPLFTPPSASE